MFALLVFIVPFVLLWGLVSFAIISIGSRTARPPNQPRGSAP
jgi:hypothetical protein